MAQTPAVDIDALKRRMITPVNLNELGIDQAAVDVALRSDELEINGVRPDGVSINETTFGNFSGPTAADLGWISYFTVGAPLVEERANIIAPTADTLSARSYVNRAATPQSYDDTVEFLISNTFNWSLNADARFTINGSITGEESYQEQQSIQTSLEKMVSQSVTLQSTPENVGWIAESRAQASVTDTETDTTTGTVTGSGTMSAELQLALSGSLSGTLTTSWTSRSSVSGEIPANGRIETMATQRRQIVQHTYELPVNFGGFVALHYPEPVYVQNAPPQSATPDKASVIAQKIPALGLIDRNLQYRPKGLAETISRLNVEHTIFGAESLANKNQGYDQPRKHYS